MYVTSSEIVAATVRAFVSHVGWRNVSRDESWEEFARWATTCGPVGTQLESSAMADVLIDEIEEMD